MPTFKPKATSAARSRLDECISARAEVDSRLAELQASITKLNSQVAAVAPAEAALANYDATSDHKALLWARGAGERPTPDIEARNRLISELASARASAESATRASATLVAEMTNESSKPNDIAKYADAAVIEVIAETATPLVDALEADAIDLVVKIIGLQAAANMARDLAERRRPRVLTQQEQELRSFGKGVAIQHGELEDGTPPEARAAVGALVERFRPAVWSRISEALIEAVREKHADISAKVIESVAAWRSFEANLRADSGVHLAGAK